MNTGSSQESKWILCGTLTGPWVAVLRRSWEQMRKEFPEGRCVIDLSDVTFIDEGGETLLEEISKEGADFVAKGVETKHLLDNLRTKGERPLRRFLAN